MERETRTVTVPWNEKVECTLAAWPEFGGWYELGHYPDTEEVGYLYAPMNLDGSFDIDAIGEVEVPYSQA